MHNKIERIWGLGERVRWHLALPTRLQEERERRREDGRESNKRTQIIWSMRMAHSPDGGIGIPKFYSVGCLLGTQETEIRDKLSTTIADKQLHQHGDQETATRTSVNCELTGDGVCGDW